MSEFTTQDVVYGAVEAVALSATLYTPIGRQHPPAVVEVHGGAWNFLDRTRNAKLCKFLAAAGIMVLSLDFRAPPNVYPASVADVNAGIRWLKYHVAAQGGDPQRVGAVGSSSGGHLVLLNGLYPKNPEYAWKPGETADPDATLHFMVACWPIVDPLARYEMAVALGLTNLAAAHDRYWVPASGMAVGNPQRILDAGSHTALPPLLIVQGTNDANMTQEMIHRFVASYQKAGGIATLQTYDGQPHDFFVAAPDAADTKAAMARIRDFIIANTSQVGGKRPIQSLARKQK